MATVSKSDRMTDLLSCDGSNTEFGFNFPIVSKEQLVVIVVDEEKNISELQIDTDFFLDGVKWSTGGTVRTVKAYESGKYIRIYSRTDVTQEISYPGFKSFNPRILQLSLNKLTHIAQELWRDISRSVQINPANYDPDDKISVGKTTKDRFLAINEENEIVTGRLTIDEVDSIAERNSAINLALDGIIQGTGITILKSVAAINNTFIDDTALLSLGLTYTGQRYFYDSVTGKTYFISEGINGSVSKIERLDNDLIYVYVSEKKHVLIIKDKSLRYLTPSMFGGGSLGLKIAVELNTGLSIVIPKGETINYDYDTLGTISITEDFHITVNGKINVTSETQPSSLEDEKTRFIFTNNATERIDVQIDGCGTVDINYDSAIGLFTSQKGKLNRYNRYGVTLLHGNNAGSDYIKAESASDNEYCANYVNILMTTTEKSMSGPNIATAPKYSNISLNTFDAMTLADPQSKHDRGWGSDYCGRVIRFTGYFSGSVIPTENNPIKGVAINGNIINGATYGIECWNGYTGVDKPSKSARGFSLNGNVVTALYCMGSNGNGRVVPTGNTLERLALTDEEIAAYPGHSLIDSMAGLSSSIVLEVAPGTGLPSGNVIVGNYDPTEETDYSSAIVGLSCGGVDSDDESYNSEWTLGINQIKSCYKGIEDKGGHALEIQGGSIRGCAVPLSRNQSNYDPSDGSEQILSINNLTIDLIPRSKMDEVTPIQIKGDSGGNLIIDFNNCNIGVRSKSSDDFLYNPFIDFSVGGELSLTGNKFSGIGSSCLSQSAGTTVKSSNNKFDGLNSAVAFKTTRGDNTVFESKDDVFSDKSGVGSLVQFDGEVGTDENYSVVTPKMDTSYYDRTVFKVDLTSGEQADIEARIALVPDIAVMSGYRSVLPSSGYHSKGECIMYENPVVQEAIFAVCKTRGTYANPVGTWQKFGGLA